MELNRIIEEVDAKKQTDRPIDNLPDRSRVQINAELNRGGFKLKNPYSVWGSLSTQSASQVLITGCIIPSFWSFPLVMTPN